VAFQPAVAELLGVADLAFAVGGAVGLLARRGARGPGQSELLAGLGALLAAQQPAGVRTQLNQAPAMLYYARKRWGLERPTDRPEGARRALERKLAAARRADPKRHPWRRDRSIWQRRTLDRTADRTAGHER
jgi:hypothetical protein